MRCDCCGRKKKLFESFAEIKDSKTSLHLCVDCNDLFYKLRDAAAEDNRLEFDSIMVELEKRMKKSSATLKSWAAKFMDKQRTKLGGPPDESNGRYETEAK